MRYYYIGPAGLRRKACPCNGVLSWNSAEQTDANCMLCGTHIEGSYIRGTLRSIWAHLIYFFRGR